MINQNDIIQVINDPNVQQELIKYIGPITALFGILIILLIIMIVLLIKQNTLLSRYIKEGK